ncbi:MAG: hypothetical protein KKA62_02870 [Nanoarchaeota archaeon]|nr:hypothetical protein [Nanoarchaeota archaeon]MBU1644599.1 hypothetical protein [Nanoarchaeota archaeon]MBU1976873.1 hypothetical protein [Nanoarchaeota archaeon]
MYYKDELYSRYHGVKKIIIGVLLLLNVFVWPKWVGLDGWMAFIAVLIILCGLLKVLMPLCGYCTVDKPALKKAGRKR